MFLNSKTLWADRPPGDVFHHEGQYTDVPSSRIAFWHPGLTKFRLGGKKFAEVSSKNFGNISDLDEVFVISVYQWPLNLIIEHHSTIITSRSGTLYSRVCIALFRIYKLRLLRINSIRQWFGYKKINMGPNFYIFMGPEWGP